MNRKWKFEDLPRSQEEFDSLPILYRDHMVIVMSVMIELFGLERSAFWRDLFIEYAYILVDAYFSLCSGCGMPNRICVELGNNNDM